MADPTVPEALAEFRFQTYYEDVIVPILQIEVRNRVSRDVKTDEDPEGFFACGEIREAVAVAALGVACGIFTREPFVRMLDYGNIPQLLAGVLKTGSFEVGSDLPYPISALPDGNVVLAWSELKMDDSESAVMQRLTDTYESLMRQVHRSRVQRKFNSELLFSSNERWAAALGVFAAEVLAWFENRVNLGTSAWLPEGLDSYFDFAKDLGVDILVGPENSLGFSNIDYMVTSDSASNVVAVIRSGSLLPFAAWRFGGADGDLAARVAWRASELQKYVTSIVANVDPANARPILYRPEVS